MRFTLAVRLGSIVVLGATVALASSPASATPAQATHAPQATQPTRSAGPALAGPSPRPHRLVTLPTGDRVDVTVDHNGRPSALVAKPRPGSAPFQSFRVGAHMYVIPRSAAVKIGHSLKLSQFDVTAAGTPIATPNFPMVTLTVKGIDADGTPSSDAFADLANVDDFSRFVGFQGFYRGVAKFSVPKGHYALTSLFFTYGPSRAQSAIRVVTMPQFTVNGASSVTIDARRATSRVSVATPRPAVVQSTDVTVGRADAKGNTFTDGLLAEHEAIYVSPTQPVSVGRVLFSLYWRLAAANGSYTYEPEFDSEGVIPVDNSYLTTAAQYATISAHYYSEVARQGLETRFSFLPWQDFGFRSLFDLNEPRVRAEYVMGNPDIIWSQDVVAVNDYRTSVLAGEQFSADRSYSPGQQVTEDWNKQPMHPGVQVDLGPKIGKVFFCPICRTGNLLTIGLWPFADNTPGHVGFADFPAPGLTESATLRLYKNGDPVHFDPNGGAITLTPAPAAYRIVVATARKAAYFTLSTKVHTEWAFRSSRADGSGTVPAGWVCADDSSNCAVVPLMMARYDLPLSLSDKHAAGVTTFGLTVDHLQGGPALPVTTAGVSVSYNDGASWATATTTSQGGGHFQVGYTTPSKGTTNGYVAIRVNAGDAAGGTFTQTILRAYALS